LTEDQLAMLWRLGTEPILCFDGDAAGRRAAYRALELALPLLEPGRALRFALLPEGQDPDDLVRSGQVQTLERVVNGARPLVDLLWAREIEAGPLDTPERRAALERRLRDAVGLIRDETLKRYYREEIETRLASLQDDAAGSAGRFRRGKGRGEMRNGRWVPPQAGPMLPPGYRTSPVLSRSLLAASGARERTSGPAPSGREALILAMVIAHPHLLHGHAEILSELEVSGGSAQRLRDALLDCAAEEELDPVIVAGRLARANLARAADDLVARVHHGDRWMLDPGADPARVEAALQQAITLQRKAETLNSELRAAERALAEDGSETNFAWLCQVLDQISSLDGAEADMDGAAASALLQPR
jgi:DNA primase